MNLDEIGAALQAARKQRKLSQAEVAAATGIGRATLSRLEGGAIEEIGIRKVLRVCEFLGLTLSVAPEKERPTLADLLREQRVDRQQRREPP